MINLEDIQKQIKICKSCDLGKEQAVRISGVGVADAELMIVGEAPGKGEIETGKPFGGHTKTVINEILVLVGIPEEKVYKTNVLKCPTPDFRDPYDGEVRACQKFLKEEIRLINPKIILSMGRTPAFFFMGNKGTVKELRGKVKWYRSWPVIITYNPLAVKRFPFLKAQLLEDLELFKTSLKKEIHFKKDLDWTKKISESLEGE